MRGKPTQEVESEKPEIFFRKSSSGIGNSFPVRIGSSVLSLKFFGLCS
jgi:hypothetical protein